MWLQLDECYVSTVNTMIRTSAHLKRMFSFFSVIVVMVLSECTVLVYRKNPLRLPAPAPDEHGEFNSGTACISAFQIQHRAVVMSRMGMQCMYYVLDY